MKSTEVRNKFFEFFERKGHRIVPSAPMVIKNDPTLMFTNAGMNQFKDIFLGNTKAPHPRIANTQKCLRVSGKHNDLEEVGLDTYHHTMFEMLGNWSFGDYFKKEAIEWAWELLTQVYGIDKNKLYATYFGGDKQDNLPEDAEARDYWLKILPPNKVIAGNKKDNFWEMGESGPCGPCSEIHIDLRSDNDREKLPGENLVNTGHPQVIEIWNLVFIQFNRMSNGKLKPLSQKHVDTGMGFERLTMVLQGKVSNYDTDIFQPIIQKIAEISGVRYGENSKSDIALRVVADHLRAVSFSIADGQLPSNNKAGYVIRRILRRAIRYGYSFLRMKEPFIFNLVPTLCTTLGNHFPELENQRSLIEKVIREEEQNFLKTLDTGIRLLNQLAAKAVKNDIRVIDGKSAFELYDTYGFPLDLTELMLRELNLGVNIKEFDDEMQAQKNRSRAAAAQETGDWTILRNEKNTVFTGYDTLETESYIVKYRSIKTKDKDYFQLVLDKTPFYAESGGQMGDTGLLISDGDKIEVIDTHKENELIVHITHKLPSDLKARLTAKVDAGKRTDTMCNHSATHLLHYALREVLGKHVEQKGSLVHPDYLRFDFSHFQKLTDEELGKIERLVNEKIRENLIRDEKTGITMEEAMKMGAIALFGEKYGESVRVIRFGESMELCGGTHVASTGQIGFFKIISESAIAAGIRRIEAISGSKAFDYVSGQSALLHDLARLTGGTEKDLFRNIEKLISENKSLRKEIEILQREKTASLKDDLLKMSETAGNFRLIATVIKGSQTMMVKDLIFDIHRQHNDIIILLGARMDEKANLWLMIPEKLVSEKSLNASELIREIAKQINGGGGGQPFFATAGGTNPDNLEKAIAFGKNLLVSRL